MAKKDKDKDKEKSKGVVVQVIGPVVDVKFSVGALPSIHNAIAIKDPKRTGDLIAEVVQHLGNDTARCIAMSSTDGLVRGMEAVNTGAPITVPVGKDVLGRVFNLLGEPIDKMGEVKTQTRLSIHRDPPTFEERETSTTVLETGLKVVDLLAPFARGGKIGLFGGAGVGKTVLIMAPITSISTEHGCYSTSPAACTFSYVIAYGLRGDLLVDCACRTSF